MRVIDTNKTMIADRLDEHIPGFPSIGWSPDREAGHAVASNCRIRRRDKVMARETDNFLASPERGHDELADLPQRAGRVPQNDGRDACYPRAWATE